MKLLGPGRARVGCLVCSPEHRIALAAMQETRHQFRESLRELERQTVDGLGMVHEQLDRALESVSEHDVELAGMVIAGDERIDRRYVEVHQGVLSLLARQAPVAGDLRLVAALLHIVRCLERMRDQCANIAKLVRLSGDVVPKDEGVLDTIERMGQVARSQVLQAMEAFATRNVTVAQNLVGLDREINRLNREIFTRAVEAFALTGAIRTSLGCLDGRQRGDGDGDSDVTGSRLLPPRRDLARASSALCARRQPERTRWTRQAARRDPPDRSQAMPADWQADALRELRRYALSQAHAPCAQQASDGLAVSAR